MRKLLVVLFLAFMAATATPALSANLACKIANGKGKPLSSVRVVVRDISGRTVRTVYTDKNGRYVLKNLAPGDYTMKILPITGGFLGGQFKIHVPPNGRNVNVCIYPAHPGLV